VISEVLKKCLNEISSDLAFAAASKATCQGRNKQSERFEKYGTSLIPKEIGTEGLKTIKSVTNKCISYMNCNGEEVCMDYRGYAFSRNRNGEFLYLSSVCPEYFKTDNFTARKIAKWCNKYITPLPKNQKQPMIFDWHFWSINY
jgi:hypothetical protein